MGVGLVDVVGGGVEGFGPLFEGAAWEVGGECVDEGGEGGGGYVFGAVDVGGEVVVAELFGDVLVGCGAGECELLAGDFLLECCVFGGVECLGLGFWG